MNLFEGLQSYGGCKLRGWVLPNFQHPLAAKLYVGPPKVLQTQEHAQGPLSPCQVCWGSDFTRCRGNQKRWDWQIRYNLYSAPPAEQKPNVWTGTFRMFAVWWPCCLLSVWLLLSVICVFESAFCPYVSHLLHGSLPATASQISISSAIFAGLSLDRHQYTNRYMLRVTSVATACIRHFCSANDVG